MKHLVLLAASILTCIPLSAEPAAAEVDLHDTAQVESRVFALKKEVFSEVRLENGQVFKNVRMTSWDRDVVRILHDTGNATIKVDDLPAELRKRVAPLFRAQLAIAEAIVSQDAKLTPEKESNTPHPIPGIAPSDLYRGLGKIGFKVERRVGDDVLQWICTASESHMDMTCDVQNFSTKEAEVSFVKATVVDGNDAPDSDSAAAFLALVAKLATGGPEAKYGPVMKWVMAASVEGGGTKTIGKVAYSVTVKPRRRVLTIEGVK